MNRVEFLKILDEELNGKINLGEINQNLQYYDSYIREQMEQGKTEEEVMKHLGDPRLIAKTILSTAKAAEQAVYEDEMINQQEESSKKSVFYFNGKRIDLSKWYMKLLTAIIVVLTLAIVISIVVLMIKVAVWIALPVLVIAGIIYLLQHIFGR